MSTAPARSTAPIGRRSPHPAREQATCCHRAIPSMPSVATVGAANRASMCSGSSRAVNCRFPDDDRERQDAAADARETRDPRSLIPCADFAPRPDASRRATNGQGSTPVRGPTGQPGRPPITGRGIRRIACSRTPFADAPVLSTNPRWDRVTQHRSELVHDRRLVSVPEAEQTCKA
jgi:hypothetical protein